MLKKLKDECYIVMGQSPSSEFYNQTRDGIPFLQGRKTFGDKFPTIDTWTTKPSKIGSKNSVLMSVRAPVGDVNIAPFDICIGRGLASIKMKNNHNQYLYYLLKNNVEKIKNKSSGTVFDAINRNDLENLVLNFNDEIEQIKIEKVLSDIDKKVELNNEINNDLHELLKNIYEDWFINHNYPNSKAKLHSNWITNRLGEYLNIERGLSYKGKFLSDDGVPMINLGNVMPDGVFRLEKNKYYSGEYKEKVTAKSGDIVIANTDMTQDRAVIGSPIIIPNVYNSDIIYSHHIYGIKNLKLPRMFVFYTLLRKEFRAVAGGSATGTTVLALPKDVIENYEIEIPDKSTLEAFSNIAETIYKKRENIMQQNIKLEQLRDTLLPKLMNGEIDLDSIEV